MNDAGKTTVEPITPERVDRDRARLLTLAEYFMTATESLLRVGDVPWSPTPASTSPRTLYDVASSPSLIGRATECARVAALCFEAATRKDKP